MERLSDDRTRQLADRLMGRAETLTFESLRRAMEGMPPRVVGMRELDPGEAYIISAGILGPNATILVGYEPPAPLSMHPQEGGTET
jgi:hypothetical protein